MYQYWLILFSCKGLFLGGLERGDVVTDRDRGAGMIKVFLLMRLLPRVLSSISSAKASHAQLPDMPLRIDTQALRLIARIPLIEWREKRHFSEEKHLHVVVFLCLCT